MIKEVPINDNWLYRRGFTQECLEREFDWSDSFIVQLPHNYKCGNVNYFDERTMQAAGTYSRILTVSDSYNGKRLLLRFEGVLSYAEVYVNGIFVTSHKGEAPFIADITAPVKYNFENRIVLKVDSALREDFGFGTRGPLTPFGGIHRDVVFMICDGRDIRDVSVRTFTDGGKKVVSADVELFDYYPETELGGEIYDENGNKAGEFITRAVMGASVKLHGEISDAVCWSPDNPVMYTASVKLKSGKKTLDCKNVRFGFVTSEFTREGFFLNGKKVKLIGVTRADCYPVIGRAATSETEKRDARIIKSSGFNAVRTMGPAGKDFIEECNRIGLMVIEDVYGDGHIGDASWRESFLESITDMVVRDRNSPCIIGWGIRVNNSPDCDELYFKANKAAKEADSTRATVGARNYTFGRLYEDVFAYNELKSKYVRKRRKLKMFVPFIIGEHGGASYSANHYDTEEKRLGQALGHLGAVADVNNGIAAGAFGMSFCDFATGRGKGNGNNINNCGVFDMHRNRKLAAYAYLSQSAEQPVMELSGNLSEYDYSGKLYVFTNADSVAVYRNDVKVGEFYPNRKEYPSLNHPPIIIDDFCGELPKDDVGDGLRFKLFKSLLADCESKHTFLPSAASPFKAFWLKKLCKKSDSELKDLLEKYSRIPPQTVTYRFEAVYSGEVKLTRKISPTVRKTLRVESSCNGVLNCTKSYERIAFSLFAEDGNGNILDYSFMPVNVFASGSLSVEGTGNLSLEGGRGGFFVRSISQGRGKVTVTSDIGSRTMEFDCKYAETEKF